MPEETQEAEFISGFVKWAQAKGISPDAGNDAELEELVDMYMRSRVAGG